MIRLARLEDLQTMTDIYNMAIVTNKCTAHTETFTREERIPWFEEHQVFKYPLYVIEIDRRIAGYIYLTPYRPGRFAMRHTAEVSYYLHPDFHGKGFGSEMLSFIINEAKEIGIKSLVAILLSINLPSMNLLKKHHFEEWGRLPNIVDFDGSICSHLYYGLHLDSSLDDL
ncbi:GNAT family N-acetyltransferase [Clostridium sediminicola]|uniref:GNAT family N-acetyltransferase n=1 Tax=Clostridium sediminicola TaxID=3114879 RepID=UPI0031F25537